MTLTNEIQQQNHGFTIVELMIATTVFSVILLICTTALIQIGKVYQKGVIANQTQEVSRTIMNDLAESIQFSSGSITRLTANGDGSQGFCIGDKRVSFLPNMKLVDGSFSSGETNHALVVDSVLGCNSLTVAQSLTGAAAGNERLSTNMRILLLNICSPADSHPSCVSPPPPASNLYQVQLTIAYGDAALINPDNTCKSNLLGGSFCTVSSLSTTVQKRIIK